MMLRVFFAGEGPDELGDWANDPAYWPSSDATGSGGVLHALVGRFAAYQTVGALRWKKIRKFRAGDHASPEARNVMGLALAAEEAGCDALVFARDRDGDREREVDVEEGIARATKSRRIRIVGGTANEELEAWVLAMKGTPRSESFSNPKEKLEIEHQVATCARMCEVVRDADFDKLPQDCASLLRWVERLKAVTESA